MSKVFLFILSAFFFVSCDNLNKKNAAIEYNDNIVELQNNIIEKMIAFTSSVETNIESSDEMLESLITECKKSIRETEEISDFEGNTELRDTGVDLFRFYQNIAENEFREMLEIIQKDMSDFTDEDYDRLEELENQVSTNEVAYDQAFQEAQMTFAKTHNLPLLPNKYQDIIDAQ